MVVECRQTVHKDRLLSRIRHQRFIDLIRGQRSDALLPDLDRLAHGYPDIGVQHIRAACRLHRVLTEAQDSAAFRRNALTFRNQRRIRKIFLRRTRGEIQAHFCAADHQRIAHIIARIAQIYKIDALQTAEMLPNGEKIRQNLCRVKFVGQTVPDRHARIFRQLLDNILSEAAVFNAVKHAAEHTRRIRYALLLSDL